MTSSFVATEHDSLYAIDASAAGGAILWQRSFLDIASNPAGDINNTLGATAITTVSSSDVNAGRHHSRDRHHRHAGHRPELRTRSTSSSRPRKRSAAIPTLCSGCTPSTSADGTDQVAPYLIGDTTNGNTNNTPVYVYGTGDGDVTDPYNGTGKPVVQFNALREEPAPALSLVNNQVYVDWASHGDNGPYHGWVVTWTSPMCRRAACVDRRASAPRPTMACRGIWEGGGGSSVRARRQRLLLRDRQRQRWPPRLNAQGFPTNANYNEALVKMVADPTTSLRPIRTPTAGA